MPKDPENLLEAPYSAKLFKSVLPLDSHNFLLVYRKVFLVPTLHLLFWHPLSSLVLSIHSHV